MVHPLQTRESWREKERVGWGERERWMGNRFGEWGDIGGHQIDYLIKRRVPRPFRPTPRVEKMNSGL